MREILTAGRYFKKTYGEKVYKIPVSMFGFTCPNIDGSVARGGCTFCENESFSPNVGKVKLKANYLNLNSTENPFLQRQLAELQSQYSSTKAKLIKKFKAEKFIIYFQSFTNTYAPLETLKKLYTSALELDDVVGISIGTRTDCMTDEILDFLAELNQKKEIWLEYGIQSTDNETLDKINRGHDVANMYKWIEKTQERGLKICAHLIFGLPNETQETMLQSTQKMVDLKIDSLKIHPLYVVSNTALTASFKRGTFTPISKEKYIDTVVKAIKLTPQNIIIQRITAGIDDDSLLAPIWCKNKHQQMKDIRDALKKENMNY